MPHITTREAIHVKHRYLNSEMEAQIEEYVPSARNRAILKLIYLDDIKYERIAEIYDLSPRTIDNIVRDFKRVAPIFR